MMINKYKLKFRAFRDNNGGGLEPEQQQVDQRMAEMELYRQLCNGVNRDMDKQLVLRVPIKQ
jgi:hypothetical protein